MKTYLILLIDRKRAMFFTISNGLVGTSSEFTNGQVPKKVKHGDDTWDSQNKIFLHIESHLHRHLDLIFKTVKIFLRENPVDAILIGSHKPLFSRIEKHLPYPLKQKFQGEFETELKIPFHKVLKKANQVISQLENQPAKKGGYVF